MNRNSNLEPSKEAGLQVHTFVFNPVQENTYCLFLK